MTRGAPTGAPGRVHGFAAALTSFVGRAGEAAELAGLLADYRLVTMTGPGGVGKTRLAAEVARQIAGRLADGVWLVELASVADPAQVPAAVATALAAQLTAGTPIVESLQDLLSRRQLLLVLDNCEHVLTAAADLCAAILVAADDVRVLATSREPLGVDGEACFRLAPLGLPQPGGAAGTGSEAVLLFADRARRADPHFALGPETAPAVADLVTRLDGMPLAIELAAARAEALGVTELAGHIGEWLGLLTAKGRQAPTRHRSLMAVADWSYRLLGEPEQRVFRQLAVFPGPFTLAAAEAVAGHDARAAVVHLVDCSLLVPPQTGADGRSRYRLLDTLRGYAAERLAEAGEQPEAAARLARYAAGVAEEAAAGLETSTGELAAARWLDAEDATVHQALDWALGHDRGGALRLALALAPWWALRSRQAVGYRLLAASAGHAAVGGEEWCAAQYWLGHLVANSDAVALAHFTAARDALVAHNPGPLLVRALNGRAFLLIHGGHVREGAAEAHRALALARELGYPTGEAIALRCHARAAYFSGDQEESLTWARQALQIDPAAIPGRIVRLISEDLAEVLMATGHHHDALRYLANALALAQEAGDLTSQAGCLQLMADLDLRAGRVPEARAHLREAIELMVRSVDHFRLFNCLETCGHLCAQTRRYAEALTVWAAVGAVLASLGMSDIQPDVKRRQQPVRTARQALGPTRAKAAEDRGTAMTPAAAGEYALLLVTAEPGELGQPPAAANLPQLSARERELVTLVARGRTNTQIAGQLYISVRTVGSHLDRIRDKTGCRRRADLTRLALQAGLV